MAAGSGLAWHIGARARRAAASAVVARRLELRVAGLEHVPGRGPALLVARHYHHLYDALVLLAVLPRPVQVLVALDWVPPGPPLRLMRWLTRAARWPAVWRPGSGGPTLATRRAALRESLALLREGHLLVVFPEGYPTIDPSGSRKPAGDAFLPFAPGFATLALAAERAHRRPPPIIPVGLAYRRLAAGRWSVAARFGRPRYPPGRAARDQFVASVRDQVIALSHER